MEKSKTLPGGGEAKPSQPQNLKSLKHELSKSVAKINLESGVEISTDGSDPTFAAKRTQSQSFNRKRSGLDSAPSLARISHAINRRVSHNVNKNRVMPVYSDEKAFHQHVKLVKQRSRRGSISERQLEKVVNRVLFVRTISPHSTFRRCWDPCTAMFVIYNCWNVPFSIAFDWLVDLSSDTQRKSTPFEVLLEVWFIMDLVLNFFTGYIDHGVLIKDRKKIAYHYLTTWFFVDFIAIFPIGSILNLNQNAIRLIKYAKIPKLLRLTKLIRHFRQYQKYAGFTTVMFVFLFLVHVSSCIWTMFIDPCRDKSAIECKPENLYNAYWTAIHFSITIILGMNDGALYSTESVFCAKYHMSDDDPIIPTPILIIHNVLKLTGLLCVAVVISNTVFVVQSWIRAGNSFRKKMDLVNYEMEYLQLPRDLRKRIRHYYDYVWRNNRTMSDDLVLLSDPSMSENMKNDIAVHIYGDLIRKTSLFESASDKLLEQICRSVRLIIYMPGDKITRKGDIDHDIYIIFRGTVEVVGAKIEVDGAYRPVFLSNGAAFGELAAILETPRTRTVQACTMCELCCLNKDTLDAILLEHPTFCDKLQQFMVKQYIQMTTRKSYIGTHKSDELTQKTEEFTKQVSNMLEEKQQNWKRRESGTLKNLLGEQASEETLSHLGTVSEVSRRMSIATDTPSVRADSSTQSGPRRASDFQMRKASTSSRRPSHLQQSLLELMARVENNMDEKSQSESDDAFSQRSDEEEKQEQDEREAPKPVNLSELQKVPDFLNTREQLPPAVVHDEGLNATELENHPQETSQNIQQ